MHGCGVGQLTEARASATVSFLAREGDDIAARFEQVIEAVDEPFEARCKTASSMRREGGFMRQRRDLGNDVSKSRMKKTHVI